SFEEEEQGSEGRQNADPSATAKGGGKRKGPKIINLDDRPPAAAAAPASATASASASAHSSSTASKAYKPPNKLTIHLSKISMPELEPRVKKGTASQLRPGGSHSSPTTPGSATPKQQSGSSA